jgi:nucleoside-diphosphate-sugar epimerase
MQRVFVTGGSGFVGGLPLVGHEVTGVDAKARRERAASGEAPR